MGPSSASRTRRSGSIRRKSRQATSGSRRQSGGSTAGVVVIGHGEQPDALDLDKLFIEPRQIRAGFGRVFFLHAIDEARRRGAKRLTIRADPYAAAFYERHGANPVGEAPSDVIPGRLLPLYEVALDWSICRIIYIMEIYAEHTIVIGRPRLWELKRTGGVFWVGSPIGPGGHRKIGTDCRATPQMEDRHGLQMGHRRRRYGRAGYSLDFVGRISVSRQWRLRRDGIWRRLSRRLHGWAIQSR